MGAAITGLEVLATPRIARPRNVRWITVTLVAVAVAAGMSLVPLTHALACYCVGPQTFQRALKLADVAFDGVVVSQHTFGGPGNQVFANTFKVDRQLKGRHTRQRITVHADPFCGDSFEVGARWRVFARWHLGHLVSDGTCSGDRPLDRPVVTASSSAHAINTGNLPDALRLPAEVLTAFLRVLFELLGAK